MKAHGYLKADVSVLLMPIYLALDEKEKDGEKIGFAHKRYISLNICMFVFKYRHLSKIQTKVKLEEYLNHAWILETERHLLIHLLPTPSTTPSTVINVTFSLFTADSQEHN